ncbi:DUF551 domain-containing protein [Klebsiella pneumoniae]|uniref:DUF551 domain-containing protein n=1 Tax=Klebsiella pneumoniae TaxID=573 RepID=UPI00296E5E98|nr:DUF551 domain-containing protein [Klebsiella pneumoniae]
MISALRELQERRKADSEPVELPLDYLQGHKDGLEWAAQLAEANHPETGDWLYDDPIELAKAIRKGPDMPPVQPVADSEPVEYIFKHPAGRLFWSLTDESNKGHDDVMPVYAEPQPAMVVPEEKPIPNTLIMYAVDAVAAIAEVKGWNACRAAMLQGKAEPVSLHPELSVWYGSMPERNGKSNWTAILHRKGECLSTGITIELSEYPERVRYEADRVRHIIGELKEEPDILAYDADAHSGYVKPGNSPVIPDGYRLQPISEYEAMCATVNSEEWPQRWIPVSERMPEEGGRYWCYVEEQNSLGKSHYQWNCSWNGNAWSDKALTGRVTHWMPLPAAPQEVK